MNYRALRRASVQTIRLPQKGNCCDRQNRSRARCISVDCILLEVQMRCGNSDKSDGTSDGAKLQCSVPKLLCSRTLLASKNNLASSLIPHVSTDCPDDRYPKLTVYTSELTLDRYQYIPVPHVTMQCAILP